MSIGNSIGRGLRFIGNKVADGVVLIGDGFAATYNETAHQLNEAKLGITGIDTSTNHKVDAPITTSETKRLTANKKAKVAACSA